MKTKYDAVIQKNERGGFEIAPPDTLPGHGVGNYGTPGDAYAVAKYNFTNVKAYVEPKAEKRPATDRPAKPFAKGQIEAAFTKLSKGRAHA